MRLADDDGDWVEYQPTKWQYRCWWLEGSTIKNGPWIDLTSENSGIQLQGYNVVELRMVKDDFHQ